MKTRASFIVSLLLLACIAGAQVPQKFNYQAVVRDSQNERIAGMEVGFRMSVLKSSTTGQVLYSESHQVTTTPLGVADLVIGEGTVISGNFQEILWGDDNYYLKVEADPAGGSAYEHLGTTQLISVPYAIYSANISSPTRKFTIQEEPGHPVDSALFEVRNADGQTVFAVYPEGTRVYILDEESKGVKGGFAVGGYGRKAKGLTNEYMRITPDSIRLYVDETATKGTKGGFAVGGYGRRAKGPTDQYFFLKPDSAKFSLITAGDVNRVNSLSIVTKSRGGEPGDFNESSLLDLTIDNYLIGHRAGESITDGIENCFIGFESGVNTTSGNGNVFIGNNSGFDNLSGSNNLFIGPKAGTMSRAGHSNILLGAFAGHQQVDGDNNIYIGSHAGQGMTAGYENIYIGYGTGEGNQEGAHNIFIGSGAGFHETGSDKLIIDSYGRDSSAALIYGDLFRSNLRINHQLGVGRSANTHTLEVEGTVAKTDAGTWESNSDARIKTDVRDIENAFEQILSLHPVKFRYTEEYMRLHPSIRDKDYYNYIAQEFREVFPEAVRRGGDEFSGGDNLLQMDSYPAQVVAIRAIQELIQDNRDLKQRVLQLEERLSARGF